MKRIYESFKELGEAMTRGEGILHFFNCAENQLYKDPCMAWQKGVLDFAEWLDHVGVKVEITDGSENFYDFIRRVSEEQEQQAKGTETKEGI